MKEFEPSADFVTTVMAGVRALEAERRVAQTKLERHLASAPLRYALTGSGILFALLNVARIAYMFVSPALCR